MSTSTPSHDQTYCRRGNPRSIKRAIDGILSLGVDVCSYMPEVEVAPAINKAIEETDYDRYFVYQ
jgi:hypothetical protein